MVPIRLLLLILLLTICAAPAFAQIVERDLPADRPLEIALWSADVRVVLRPGAAPRLTARAAEVEEGATEAIPADGPLVDLRDDGATLRVLRVAESETVRLRVEVTLDVGHPVQVTGDNLDVAVEAPPLDFREMATRRRLATERGEEPPAPSWTDVTLQVESSRADLSGVAGGVLRGRDSWFVVRQSANQLAIELEGGAAELTRHRGVLRLEGRGGEVELRDVRGEILFQLEGARLAITDGEGRLEGQARDGAILQLDAWGGHVEVESFASVLELRGFRPGDPLLYVRAESSDVTLEGLTSGQLDLDVKGGRLRLWDVQGKMKLAASHRAEVELDRLQGSWAGDFRDSTIVARELERFDFELTNTDFRLEDAADLRLTANGSEIDASGVRSLRQSALVDTRADLELTEGARAKIEARGQSQVFVAMETPCFVLTPSPRKGEDEATALDREALAGLDVTGCTLGADVGRDDRDDVSASPSFLTLTLGEDAELDVRGL